MHATIETGETCRDRYSCGTSPETGREWGIVEAATWQVNNNSAQSFESEAPSRRRGPAHWSTLDEVSLMTDLQNDDKLAKQQPISQRQSLKTCFAVPLRKNITAKLNTLYDDTANELHTQLTGAEKLSVFHCSVSLFVFMYMCLFNWQRVDFGIMVE